MYLCKIKIKRYTDNILMFTPIFLQPPYKAVNNVIGMKNNKIK